MNYIYKPKESNNINRNGANKNILNKSKVSGAEGFHKRKSINSSIISAVNKPIQEYSSQTNLKVIQKELQFKLLDMSMAIENTPNSDEDDDNYFSNEKKTEKKNLDYEISSLKSDINAKRKMSVIIGNSANIFNNFNNKELKNLNKSHNKGINSFKKNNIGFFNLASFRGGQNNIKSFRRKSFSGGRNSIMNNSSRKSLTFNGSSLNITKRNSMFFSRVNMSVNNFSTNHMQNIEFENKYRNVLKKKELYDSYEDEEIIEDLEEEYFFINPETHKIFIFDNIILMCNLFCSFYYPLFIAQSNCFCSYIPKLTICILLFTDFINTIDIILSFFRAYYNYEFALIKKSDKIVRHYFKTYFIPDLIAAIPFFTYGYLL